MDTNDFQFLQRQVESSNLFLPESAYDLSRYTVHLEHGASQIAEMSEKEAKEWYIDEAARMISEIERKSALIEELYNSVEAMDNVEEESKGDVGDRTATDYDAELAAIDDAQNDQADAARNLAFATILMARKLQNEGVMNELATSVAGLLAEVAVDSEPEEAEEGGVEGEGDGEEGEGEGDGGDVEESPNLEASPELNVDDSADIQFDVDSDSDVDFGQIGGFQFH